MLNIQLPFNGTMRLVFRQTDFAVQIAGIPHTPYRITLIGLLIIVLLSIVAMAITEQLTGTKPGGVLVGIATTIIGSVLTATFILVPFDFMIEGVRVIAALLGAVVVTTFFTLLRSATSGGAAHSGGGGGHGGGH